MGPEVVNKNKNCVFNGPYAGRDLYITMLEDTEREFVVTHNANIKPVYYFTGRETELKELRQRAERGRKSVLVSGMGGIGKTHICRKLFEEYYVEHNKGRKEPFQHIGYIEYNGDMNSSLQTCLKYKEQTDSKLNQEAAWEELKHLASNEKLLLIVDNVNVPISKDKGLQRLTTIPGAIIITSRLTSFCDEFEPYKIGFLDIEQCKEIYERIRFENSGKKVDSEEIQDLEYIIEKLAARHTITIEHLAHLAYVKRWTVRELKEKLEEKRFKIGYHKNGELINIQESYEVLYNLSELSKSEQNILEAFSVFPYIPLEANICNQWLLSDAGVSEEDDILTGLYQKGWLQFDMEQDGYSLHPVFAQFIYEKCKPKTEDHMQLLKLLENDGETIVDYNASELLFLVLISESIIEKIVMRSNAGLSDFNFMFVFYFIFSLIYLGSYEKAEQMCKNILSMFEKELAKNYEYKVMLYLDLILIYQSKGDFSNAKIFYKKCSKYENKLGDKYIENVLRHIDLADILHYEESEKLYKKSIKICEREYGESHPQTVKCYIDLADMYNKQGIYSEAEKWYDKCLRIYKKDFENNYLKIASIYNKLAYIYSRNGDNKKVEEMYIDSIELNKGDLNKNFIEIMDSCRGLMDIYWERGNYKVALNYCFISYKISVLKLGLRSQQTLIIYAIMEIKYYTWKPEGNFIQWLEEKIKEE